MAPLILHNVPDEELYIGDDGIKRPYAIMFPQFVPFPFYHIPLLTLESTGKMEPAPAGQEEQHTSPVRLASRHGDQDPKPARLQGERTPQ